MARARPFNDSRIIWLNFDRCAGHYFPPMHKVTVLDHQGYRRTERFTVPYAGDNLDLVLFDLHSATAAIALLPTPKFMIDIVDVNG
jgi:hypothetical protein